MGVLLEAGLPTTTLRSTVPRGSSNAGTATKDWGYRTVPQAGCAGRELPRPRGRVLGDSSALNGMIHVRRPRDASPADAGNTHAPAVMISELASDLVDAALA